MDLPLLIESCAPHISPVTMTALISTESNKNPYAIGVVGGLLERQPRTKEEAVSSALALKKLDHNFSLGLGQVNLHNLEKYNLSIGSAFNACTNLKASSAILQECYGRAKLKFTSSNDALDAALSCYYSGNFKTGFIVEKGQTKSYVNKVKANANLSLATHQEYVVPALSKQTVVIQSKESVLSRARFSANIRSKLREDK